MRYILFCLCLFSCQKSYILNESYLILEKKPTSTLYSIRENKTYNFPDLYKNIDGVVLFFWQNNCPCVKRYQNRIIDLWTRYRDKNIGFFFIASNSLENDDEIKREYQQRKIPLEILRDKKGLLAKALKVKSTPTAVLLDNEGSIKFIGWIDNERDLKEKYREAYLENALKEFLQKQPITKPTSPMFGCPII